MKKIYVNDRQIKKMTFYHTLKEARAEARKYEGYTVVRCLNWYKIFVGYAVVAG